jgi:hypothetical protein
MAMPPIGWWAPTVDCHSHFRAGDRIAATRHAASTNGAVAKGADFRDPSTQSGWINAPWLLLIRFLAFLTCQ